MVSLVEDSESCRTA